MDERESRESRESPDRLTRPAARRRVQVDDSDSLNDAPTLPMTSVNGWGSRMRESMGRNLPLRILLVVLLVALVGGAIFAGVYASRQPRPAYATAHVGDVILSFTVSGIIQATTYQADFPEDGTLSAINVTVGQQVHAGETLATLAVAPFQSALTAAQNNESATQQSLSDAQGAQTQAQSAQSDAQNALSSAQSALTAEQAAAATACATSSTTSDPTACSTANAAVAHAQAQVDAAQAQVSAAQTQLAITQAQLSAAQKSATAAQSKTEIAQAQLTSATLVAPHNGIVTNINGAVGGRPGATANGTGSFITIMDTAAPLATAMVNYRTVGAVHTGDVATFRVTQASQNVVFKGTVTGVSPLGSGTGAALSYPVTLRLDPSSLKGVSLLPGMSAATRIITQARYHVIVVPASAVTYARSAAPTSGKGLLTRNQVTAALAQAKTLEQQAVASGFPVADDPLTPGYLLGFQKGHYVAIPVVLGLTDGQQWEIVAGVTKGDQVVAGQRSLIFG